MSIFTLSVGIFVCYNVHGNHNMEHSLAMYWSQFLYTLVEVQPHDFFGLTYRIRYIYIYIYIYMERERERERELNNHQNHADSSTQRHWWHSGLVQRLSRIRPRMIAVPVSSYIVYGNRPMTALSHSASTPVAISLAARYYGICYYFLARSKTDV